MADDETTLPEGTDTVIAGASKLSGDDLTGADASTDSRREISAPQRDSERPFVGSGDPAEGLGASPGESSGNGASGSLTDRLRSSGERLTGQVTDHARGLLGQGLERSSEALAGVSRTIGDTAQGIDERLGSEYGDYARRAASAIDSAANSLASKNPDELIDDARGFIRSSPGIALAGAAVVGFVVARLVKSGFSSGSTDEADRD